MADREHILRLLAKLPQHQLLQVIEALLDAVPPSHADLIFDELSFLTWPEKNDESSEPPQ